MNLLNYIFILIIIIYLILFIILFRKYINSYKRIDELEFTLTKTLIDLNSKNLKLKSDVIKDISNN